ncbi:MAG: ADP-ribosylglycohydrolase family protein [Planctomycetota bacterium]
MYGLAIGDALGYPVEFLREYRFKATYKEKGLTDFLHTPALYSDDTQMSIAIAKALISSADAEKLDDIDYVMEKVTNEFIDWFLSPDHRGPGRACLKGCNHLNEGESWETSGDLDAKGCGSAMRTAPIGLVYHDDIKKLKEIAIATAKPTHQHPAALAGAVGTAYLVALGLNKTKPELVADNLLELTDSMSDIFTQRILQVKKSLNFEPEEAFKVIGAGWVAEEAVAGALYCFLRSPDNYSQSVLTAVNFSGDRDSVACITGAISGAYNGINAIPEKWIKKVENSDLLNELADKLYNIKSIR